MVVLFLMIIEIENDGYGVRCGARNDEFWKLKKKWRWIYVILPKLIFGSLITEDLLSQDLCNSTNAKEWMEEGTQPIHITYCVRSEYDHAFLRLCRSRALYEGLKMFQQVYIDFDIQENNPSFNSKHGNNPSSNSNMAFIGYMESVSNLHTSEMRCKWLVRILHDEFKLLCTEKMLEQITSEMDIMKTSTRFYKRTRYAKRWDGVVGGRRAGWPKHLALTTVKTMMK
ncbi:hypothetical protein Tco_0598092 [Tanacetum coccineum]